MASQEKEGQSRLKKLQKAQGWRGGGWGVGGGNVRVCRATPKLLGWFQRETKTTQFGGTIFLDTSTQVPLESPTPAFGLAPVTCLGGFKWNPQVSTSIRLCCIPNLGIRFWMLKVPPTRQHRAQRLQPQRLVGSLGQDHLLGAFPHGIHSYRFGGRSSRMPSPASTSSSGSDPVKSRLLEIISGPWPSC